MTDRAVSRSRRSTGQSIFGDVSEPNKARNTATPLPAIRVIRGTLWFLVASLVLASPLIIDPYGYDSFRIPKEALFTATAILLATTLSIGALTSSAFRSHLRSLPRYLLILAAVSLGWTIVVTVLSSNRLLSRDALLVVVASEVVFFGALIATKDRGWIAIDVMMVPSIINALLVCLQEYGLWQPFQFSERWAGHPSTTALMGNPNYVGSLTMAPALIAVAAMMSASSNRRRWFYGFCAAVLLVGLLVSGSRAAVISYFIALAVLALAGFRNVTYLVGGAVAVVGVMSLLGLTILRETIPALIRAIPERRYHVLLSERLVPFLAAVEMTRDEPVFGVGPGAFKWHYMRYRMSLKKRYPAELSGGTPENFGEVHNDHLQLAAEAGLPAAALFIVVLAAIAARTLRGANQTGISNRKRFGIAISAPLAVGIFFLCLAQFPLQLAASRTFLLYSVALALSWGSDA